MLDDTEHDDNAPEHEDHNLQMLRAKAAKFDEETARAAELERKVAIADAGIDLRTDLGKFFAENYQGDLDTVTLKAEATRLRVPLTA